MCLAGKEMVLELEDSHDNDNENERGPQQRKQQGNYDEGHSGGTGVQISDGVGADADAGYGGGHALAFNSSQEGFHLFLNPDLEIDENAIRVGLSYLLDYQKSPMSQTTMKNPPSMATPRAYSVQRFIGWSVKK